MPYSNITITTNSSLSFRQYDFIQVTHDADNYIIGRVVSYNSANGQLTFTPLVVKGSGSFSTWEVTLTGDPGDDGTSGSSGTAGQNSTSGTSGSSLFVNNEGPNRIIIFNNDGTVLRGASNLTFDGHTLVIDPFSYSVGGDPVYRVVYHNDGTAGTAGIVIRAAIPGQPYSGIVENRVPHDYQHQFVVGSNNIAHIDAQGLHIQQALIADNGVYFESLELDPSQTRFLVWDPSTSGGLQGKIKWRTSGAEGAQGPAGAPGSSGSSGTSGTSGETGASGSSGTSGENGTSGTSGETGASGSSGTSGNGTSGTSGAGFVWRGEWQPIPTVYVGGQDVVSYTGGSYIKIGDGNSGSAPPDDPVRWGLVADKGSSGTSGLAGTSGQSGTSGTSGNGTSGTSGETGTSGSTGTAGSSGSTGSSGTSGSTGTSGSSGQSGAAGTSGSSGTAGSSGSTGSSGTSGSTGTSGSSGQSGAAGTSGSSGTAGTSFASPYSGNLNVTSGQAWVSADANGNTTSSTTVNWNDSNVQTFTLNAATTTFTFSNGQAGATYILIIRQNASGSQVITWPGTVAWTGAATPTMTSTASRYDVFTFIFDGSKYFGSYIQNFT
jgi:hypothetical protein